MFGLLECVSTLYCVAVIATYLLCVWATEWRKTKGEMEERKGALIEALSRKAAALLELEGLAGEKNEKSEKSEAAGEKSEAGAKSEAAGEVDAAAVGEAPAVPDKQETAASAVTAAAAEAEAATDAAGDAVAATMQVRRGMWAA